MVLGLGQGVKNLVDHYFLLVDAKKKNEQLELEVSSLRSKVITQDELILENKRLQEQLAFKAKEKERKEQKDSRQRERQGDKRTNRQTEGRTDRQNHGQSGRQTDIKNAERQMGKRRTDRRTDGLTDGQTDGQTD